MSTYVPPAVPTPGGDPFDDDDAATKEVDGETVLDPDANDDLVDSADADRIAADGDADADGGVARAG